MASVDGSPGFPGFGKAELSEGEELNRKFSLRRMSNLEEMMEKLMMKVDQLEKERSAWQSEKENIKIRLEQLEKERLGWQTQKDEMNKEKEKLRGENENLKKQVENQMVEVRKCREDIQTTVQNVEKRQAEWQKITEESGNSLKEIMEQQKCEKEEIERKIVSVIKEKKRMVRDTVDKVKCVVLFGLNEGNIMDRMEREREEKARIQQVITEVVEDGDRAMSQVEEYFRLGKYEEGKERPLRIKFATQAQAEEVIRGSWKLAKKEEYKRVWINRDLDEAERRKQKELIGDANEKNDIRTEEEKKKYYWKVVDLKVVKRYYRK